jgi:PAS domain S-box-containing protein
MHTAGFGIGAGERPLVPDGNIDIGRQESLLKTGALQNAIFNSANFSSIATDEKGVIQIFNVGAERMLGYSALDVLNRITPADISDPQEMIARAAELSRELDTTISPGFEALVFKASRGIEDIYELSYIRKDGSRFPAVVSVTALRDDHNAIIGYLLIGTDNTARKQAEEALLKAGALQNAIFNSANFSSIATDAKGVIQIFNVGAERMLGYTALDVMNKITPADISDPQEVIARAKALSLELDTPITPGFEALVFKASRGIEDIYELTYFRKDGSRFPAVVSVTALRDAQNAIIGYLLIGTDNTARKQAEEALLKAGALQSAIFNSANFSSIATDAKGVIQIFNVGAERMLGYTALDVLNKNTPADISDPQEVIARAKALSLELDTPITPGFEALVFKASRGIEDIYELTYVRKDGSRFPAIVSVTALRDVHDDIIGYLLIGTDNTARKQVEEERKRFEHTLEVKNIELERASRMKSEFLATMSHELRTPLNAIIGFSEALKDGLLGQTSEQQHDCIDDIFTSGQHLLSLINDILDLSKVEAGMMQLELEAVDLHHLLPNSLTIVREKAAAQNIALDLEIDADLGVPQLDMRKTKQIVYNLLSNAVKFSANRGPVTLHARRVPRSAVGRLDGHWPVHSFPLAENEYQDFLEICVSDHGIGISQADMAKLFQAFSQIDSSLARKFEGTGLGLAMVRQLAELQGGAVAVASAEGEGSRFAAWLPMRTPNPGAAP